MKDFYYIAVTTAAKVYSALDNVHVITRSKKARRKEEFMMLLIIIGTQNA